MTLDDELHEAVLDVLDRHPHDAPTVSAAVRALVAIAMVVEESGRTDSP